MTKICIIGGKLQGVEALYLAGKAGYYTTLIDCKKNIPGQKFCSRFIHENVINCKEDTVRIMREADFVLPALENKDALNALKVLQIKYPDIHLVYDEMAYGISSSKRLSDEMFLENKIPCPAYYPDGHYPYIAKPSNLSGSHGVRLIADELEMADFRMKHAISKWVVQEFIEGPSYSIEIIGVPGNYRTYHITELFMDEGYDCKRVFSCPEFPSDLEKQFRNIAIDLANMVQLHGIMDVEVIERDGILYVLEIDARIPSQTPIDVYHATGWNFITELARYFGKNAVSSPSVYESIRYVALEQVLVDDEAVTVLGEHILSNAVGLELCKGFVGADEAITDYSPDKESWVATLICIGKTQKELDRKRKGLLMGIQSLTGKDLEWRDYYPASLI